jgi:hypothetical protein
VFIRSCFFVVFFLSGFALYGDSLPGWFISLRDTVYEQRLRADEVAPLYREASQKAAADLTGQALYTALSRCEYTAALYMIASRWVYAPVPFNNYPRGIRMMEDILKENERNIERDDRFNVYSAIAYAYMQQRKYQEARSWLENPTNKFAGDMLKKTSGNPAGISGGLLKPEDV